MSRTNCPNCGAPLDENYCKCPYCGTLYYDLTVLDNDVPCYVKFRTSRGTITTFAKPELREINAWIDTTDFVDQTGYITERVFNNKGCDMEVTFHSIVKNKSLYILDTRDRK